MNIDTRKFSENKEERENTPLTQEDFFQFERKQERICEIKQEWNREILFSKIESYNMIQEFTLWKVEYCSREGIEYIVKSWDSLTKICQEYYGNMQVAYDIMEMYWVSEDLWIWQELFLPKQIWESHLDFQYLHSINSLWQKENIQEIARTQFKEISEYLSWLQKIDSNYNVLEWFEIVEDRRALYQKILDANILGEWFLKESLRNYTDDQMESTDYFVDLDEELIKEFIKQKWKIKETLQENDRSIELDTTYIFLVSKTEEYKNKVKEMVVHRGINKKQIEDFSYSENFKQEYYESLAHLYESLLQDYRESLFADEMVDDRFISNLSKFIERFESSDDSGSVSDFVAFVWESFHILRNGSQKTIELLWSLLKIVNHTTLYHPSSDKKWYIEKSFPFFDEGEIDLWSPVNTFASALLDVAVDLWVVISKIVLQPEEIIKDLKSATMFLKYMTDEWAITLIRKWKNEYMDFFENDMEEASTLTLYSLFYLWVLFWLWRKVEMPSNAISYTIEKSGQWVGKLRYYRYEKDLIKKQDILEKNFNKQMPVLRDKIDRVHKVWNEQLGLLKKEEKIYKERYDSLMSSYETIIKDWNTKWNNTLYETIISRLSQKKMSQYFEDRKYDIQRSALKSDLTNMKLETYEFIVNLDKIHPKILKKSMTDISSKDAGNKALADFLEGGIDFYNHSTLSNMRSTQVIEKITLVRNQLETIQKLQNKSTKYVTGGIYNKLTKNEKHISKEKQQEVLFNELRLSFEEWKGKVLKSRLLQRELSDISIEGVWEEVLSYHKLSSQRLDYGGFLLKHNKKDFIQRFVTGMETSKQWVEETSRIWWSMNTFLIWMWILWLRLDNHYVWEYNRDNLLQKFDNIWKVWDNSAIQKVLSKEFKEIEEKGIIDESKIQDYLFSQIKNFVEANKIRLFDMGKVEYILSVWSESIDDGYRKENRTEVQIAANIERATIEYLDIKFGWVRLKENLQDENWELEFRSLTDAIQYKAYNVPINKDQRKELEGSRKR